MKRILTLAAIMAPLALAALPSQAVTPNPLPALSKAEQALATPVHFGRCAHWRRVCANRWPLMGPRYIRCLAAHGCRD
jgi:hypothetical protein